MQILSSSETASALPWAKLVPALARAARELSAGRIQAPPRQVIRIDGASVLLTMPAVASDLGVAKVITVHADNARHQLPAIQGEVLVFETSTGRRLALLDGPAVTARRTAAMTLLGIQTLAARAPGSALVIGTGAQAAAHASALAEHLGVAELWIAGIDLAAAVAFCDSLRTSHPAVSARPAAASALPAECLRCDVVVAVTTSSTPVVPASIAPHSLAIGVGAFRPDMAELPAELLRSREIVVDDLEGARHEAGDLLQAGVDWGRVRALSTLLDRGPRAGGPAPVLKTVGQAAWDLAAARVAVESLGAGA